MAFVPAVAGAAWGFAGRVATSEAIRGGASRVAGAARAYAGTGMHQRAMTSTLQGMGLGRNMGFAGRALGIGFLGLEMYSGYQKEGAWGAAKGAAGYAAFNYAFGAIAGSAALPLVLAGGAAVGGAIAYKWGANKGRQYMKGQRRTEFGAGVSDQFGTVATMRRRSVMALQESRIGGGMGMGNEAMRSYQPYFR